MPVGEHYRELIAQLRKIYEPNEAKAIAGIVMEHALKLPLWKIRDYRKVLNTAQKHLLSDYTAKLLNNTPVQYVLQEAWFHGLKFYVDENVLIPRPETEELVDWVMKDRKPGHQVSVLDIGTGSGCIPISLKKQRHEYQVAALELLPKALGVARRNAEFQQVEIEFHQMDFLNESLWHSLPAYDVLISNPPYIPRGEQALLDKHVRDFEPDAALFVPQNDPLIFYKKLAEFGNGHLKTKGAIYAEIHRDFSKQVRDLFIANGYSVEMKKDIFDNDRMIKAFSC